jgi:hypothetical protein
VKFLKHFIKGSELLSSYHLFIQANENIKFILKSRFTLT